MFRLCEMILCIGEFDELRSYGMEVLGSDEKRYVCGGRVQSQNDIPSTHNTKLPIPI